MNFDEQQNEIIRSIDGAYLISAPVGTGKTTVLAERVITALNSGIRPEEILCLTFTNRAAEEMAEKIKTRIGKKDIYDHLTVKTFHGFCVYFIKAEAKRIGIDPNFIIFDEADQLEIIKGILSAYPQYAHFEKKWDFLGFLDNLYKYRMEKLKKEIGCKVDIGENGLLDEIAKKYLRAMREQNALDFNELVLTTINTLYCDEKLRIKWSKKYKLIQLDEFQDTHISEYLVIKELAKGYKNISFIGDLDQTIYGWRGSEPYFIAEVFKKHFAPVKELNLEINYRFNKNILEAVKSFLQKMNSPATKNIKCANHGSDDSRCIDVFNGYNFSEEVKWAIGEIDRIQVAEPEARIAVLLRTHFLIGKTAEFFSQNNVSHVTVDKYDFFKRQEIKDIIAYLKIIFNKFDLESARRLTERPSRNIGDSTLKTIREKGALAGMRISDFLDFKNYNFKEPFENLISRWDSGRIIVLDTETTGTDVLKDEIIQIYAVEVVGGEMGKEFHFFIKNSVPVGLSAQVHGLTDEFLKKDGCNPKEVLLELKKFIGTDAIAGHNINFDLSMIVENGKRNGIDFVIKEYYDTLDISKRLIDAENYKLSFLANILGLPRATHDAKDDVLATVGLSKVLIEKLKTGIAQRTDLFAKFSGKFIQLAGLINNWQKLVKEKRPHEAARHIWESSGLEGYYNNDKDKERRFGSINTLVKLFEERDDGRRPADVALRDAIQNVALSGNLDFLGLEDGKVPIITVHTVKGLEFDYVFVLGLNDRIFPSGMPDSDFEEEKRLFYVAMTRARKKLFLACSNFNDYGRPSAISPFIDFIGAKFLNYR
ncbi:UvrD-helicase domain-containing protein [Candidatus Parcubacteria bacterium]|nr:UvrD-helicase domain-containing protein [Patescibacteria group bacterium]MCG2694008.1 UvrD-helicase domain-containing protein [Candidatus Parcubacteria bacterium]